MPQFGVVFYLLTFPCQFPKCLSACWHKSPLWSLGEGCLPVLVTTDTWYIFSKLLADLTMTFTVPATLKLWCILCSASVVYKGILKWTSFHVVPRFQSESLTTLNNSHPPSLSFPLTLIWSCIFSTHLIITSQFPLPPLLVLFCLKNLHTPCKPEGILLSPQMSQVTPRQKGLTTEVWTFPCCHSPASFEHPAKVAKPAPPISDIPCSTGQGFSNANVYTHHWGPC